METIQPPLTPDDAEKKSRQFVHGITHDLKEPLAKVITISELLSDKLKNLDADDRDYLSRMSESARTMKKQIEELARHYGNPAPLVEAVGVSRKEPAKASIPIPRATSTESKKKTILFIDDDEDDFLLMRDIFQETGDGIELRWAKDGEEALDYLHRRGNYTDSQNSPTPFLVLLDLNMPKLNGREVLRQIRNHPMLSYLPVVVLTNSMNQEEALQAYRIGVNSFVRKPAGYSELREFVQTFKKYWFTHSLLLG